MPKKADDPISVQLLDMPKVDENYLDEILAQKWNRLMKVRTEVLKQLENARQDKLIGNSLEAAVHIYAEGKMYDFLKESEELLALLFITSEAYLQRGIPSGLKESEDIKDLAIKISKASGYKCERCWIYSESVGANLGHPNLCARCIDVLNNASIVQRQRI
jgi:isoleucyl-tRNA synthetase